MVARTRAPRRDVVRGGVSATLRAFLERYPKVNVERLLLAAGLDPAELGDPDASLDQRHWFSFVEAASRETGDAAIGVNYANQLPWKDLGVLGYVGLHSPTVRAALDNWARFFSVQQSGGRLTVEVGSRETRVHYAVDTDVEHGQISESTFAIITRLIREAIEDSGWGPRAVAFRHDDPAAIETHRGFFRVTPRWRQRSDTLTIATTDLDRPFRAADAGLLPHLLAHAEACLAQVNERAGTDDVRRAVIAALGAGDPAIEHVAARLGHSPRTLQRTLQAEGRSFKEVVDDTRLDLARRYLADPALTLTETAFLLGYSELSAFSRAFRRWTGETALAFRANRVARNAGSSPRPTRTR